MIDKNSVDGEVDEKKIPRWMEKFIAGCTKENVARWIFFALAAFSALAVFTIVVYLFIESIPVFAQVGFFKFIFSSQWSGASGVFGILPMIVTSIVLTAFAIGLGGTLSIFVAVFIVFYCPKQVKKIYVQLINLLAGIPSLIYGYFGLIVLKPFFEWLFGIGSASGLLLSGIVLSVMILPTVTSLVKNSLENVPMNYYEGALGLGCTKNQAVFRVLLPAAKNGIIAALILGIGRAVGETMAVQLLLGNQVRYPLGFFLPISSLTSSIVLEFGYSYGLWRKALIAIGFILLLFILAINLCLWLVKKNNAIAGNKFFSRKVSEGNAASKDISFRRTGSLFDVLWIASWAISILTILILGFIVGMVFINGVPQLSFNFLFGESGYGQTTLAPAFVTTIELIIIALLISLPLGTGAAIYLNEYAKKGSKLVSAIRLFIDTLSGIPSIVFGLFGAILFGGVFKLRYSVLGGGLTLSIMILPTIIRSIEQALSEVPDSMREGSLALGAGKMRTIFVVVLPQALSGIITSIILSIGRIVGESAALIYTAGTVSTMPRNIFKSGSSFAVMMYKFMSEGLQVNECYGAAAVLMIFVIILNLLVTAVEYYFHKRNKV